MVLSPSDQALRLLVDRYRSQCLWFLRQDYYPLTLPERERVLSLIERHGDLEAFRAVSDIRAWHSQSCNGTSVVC